MPQGRRQNQPSSDFRNASTQRSMISGMADQRLSQERRLLRVIGDKAHPTEQSEPIHSTEPPLDRTRRHAFNGKPEGIPQGGPQKGSNQTILEVITSSHRPFLIVQLPYHWHRQDEAFSFFYGVCDIDRRWAGRCNPS